MGAREHRARIDELSLREPSRLLGACQAAPSIVAHVLNQSHWDGCRCRVS